MLARPDDGFAEGWLRPAEYRLYRGMDVRDREHACRIAHRLLTRSPDVDEVLVRAALLHDVGKSTRPYNPLYRILTHLYAPSRVAAEPRYRGLRGAWQVRRHHHRYGADMILAGGGTREVAELVERHHRPGGDPNAELLKSLDDET